MQRPVMDPMQMLVEDDSPVHAGPHPSRLRAGMGQVARGVKWAARLMASRPFPIRRRDPEDARPVVERLAKWVGYRMLFMPIFIALAAAALVFRGTHPIRLASDTLPEVPGVFYETTQFAGPDGYPLMAWFVPVVDAKRVIELKNKVFKDKQAAVVLVHDYNATPSQMTPLIGPLHEQGLVVMVVGLRGEGRGRVAAQTFGLNESSDVRGAIAELRKRPTVDGDHIALVGIGSGANAAVLAAAQEPGVRAMVLVNPWETPEQMIAARIGPERAGLRWMQQVSKWAFEIAYHVDADDLNLASFRETLAGRATLSLARASGEELDADTVAEIREFCHAHLPLPDSPAVATTE